MFHFLTYFFSLSLSFLLLFLFASQVLARDRLAGALKAVLERDYASQVSLHYEHALVEAEWASEEVTLTFNPSGAAAAATAADESSSSSSTSDALVVKAPFMVGADGAVRFVADKLAALENPSSQPQEQQKVAPQAVPSAVGATTTTISTSDSPSSSTSGGRPAPKAIARLAGRVGTKLARVMGRERPLRIVR